MENQIKIQEACKQVRTSSLWDTEKHADLFKKALEFVKNIDEFKLFENETRLLDSESNQYVRRWQAEIDGAYKLQNLVAEHLSVISVELLGSCNSTQDTRYLLSAVFGGVARQIPLNQQKLYQEILREHDSKIQILLDSQNDFFTDENLMKNILWPGSSKIKAIFEKQLSFCEVIEDTIRFCKCLKDSRYLIPDDLMKELWENALSKIKEFPKLVFTESEETAQKLFILIPSRREEIPFPKIKTAFEKKIEEIGEKITEYEESSKNYDEKHSDFGLRGELEPFDIHEEPYLLEVIDGFFSGRENHELVIEILARYKKVLRNRIRKFDISGLENFYHHTMYNTVSSKVTLERYDILMQKKVKVLTPEKALELKDKVLSESRISRKIKKIFA